MENSTDYIDEIERLRLNLDNIVGLLQIANMPILADKAKCAIYDQVMEGIHDNINSSVSLYEKLESLKPHKLVKANNVKNDKSKDVKKDDQLPSTSINRKGRS
jgi:hypothetical protein